MNKIIVFSLFIILLALFVWGGWQIPMHDNDYYIRVLEDKSRGLSERVSAVDNLLHTADKQTVEPLCHILRDHTDNITIRRTILLIFSRLQDCRATEPLIELVKAPSDKIDEGSKSMALDALRHIGDPSAFDPLLAILNNTNKDSVLRPDILRAIGSTKDPRAYEILKHEVNGSSYPDGAIDGLASMGDKRSIALLVSFMKTGRDVSIDNPLAYKRTAVVKPLVNTNDVEAIDAVYMEYKESENILKRKEIPEYKIISDNALRFIDRVVESFAESVLNQLEMEILGRLG